MRAQAQALPPEGDVVRAALWMTGAIVSFSLMAVAGREVAGDLDTFEVMLYRSLIGAGIVTLAGLATGRLPDARTRKFRLHAVRNVFHFAGQNLWFYGVAVIPLAQVFAFEFTTPIWVALMAPLVLGETMTRQRLVAVLIGFAGILIVARPGLSPLGPGHLAAAAAAIGFAGSVLATKGLSRTEGVWTILFWMTWMQVLFGLICAGYDGDIALPQAGSAIWVCIVGICGLAAHLSIATALRHAPATVVSPMDFARLPIIALVAMVLYGEPLEIAVFAGAALILTGNLMNIRANRRAR
ncbi:MAG TPA: DMT family transporter [Thermohalobaculum sp.]|nr:DMT family transporter [Thermohalobaculum sp.]